MGLFEFVALQPCVPRAFRSCSVCDSQSAARWCLPGCFLRIKHSLRRACLPVHSHSPASSRGQLRKLRRGIRRTILRSRHDFDSLDALKSDPASAQRFGAVGRTPATARRKNCRSSRAGRFDAAYLRAAQAYMLISMPTDTSTIFGVFQVIRVSQLTCK